MYTGKLKRFIVAILQTGELFFHFTLRRLLDFDTSGAEQALWQATAAQSSVYAGL